MRQPGFEPGSLPWQGNILTRFNYYRTYKQPKKRLFKDYEL